jgi:hypothetical protein
MKKLSYLTLALVISAMVACKGKEKKDEGGEEEMEDMTQQVEQGASEQVSNATTLDAVVEEMDSEEELFGTDVDDSKTGL